MTRLMGSRPHKTRRQGEERREKSEERREKKEEKRDPKRGRQRSPNEAARGGPTLFSAIPPSGGTSGGFEGRGKRAEKREKRAEKAKNTFFFVFSLSAEGVFPKDSMTLGPSRWPAVAARGRSDPPKPQLCLRKQSFSQTRSFASEDVWRPLEGASGSDSTHLVSTQKKVSISKNLKKKFGDLRGRPRVPRRWPPARLTPYLQCPVRRPDLLLFYRVGGPRAPSHPVKMESICSAADRGLEGAKTELFPLPGGSWGARRGPRKSFENPRGPPRWPQARFTAFLQGAVAPSLRAKKFQQKSF